MPMGIVSDSEFESEVSSYSIQEISRGRGSKGETPEVIRELVAEDSINGTPASEVSEKFNVSKSSVSAYKVGATSTSTYHNPIANLLSKNKAVKKNIFSKSKRVLLNSLSELSEEKLKASKAIDLASIAKNMSGIMKDMDDESINSQTFNQQVIIYKPRIQTEEEFEIIDVRE